jgi:hypothetical protein
MKFNRISKPRLYQNISNVMYNSWFIVYTNSVVWVCKRTILTERPPPTFANRGCHVVSVTVPHGRIFGFLDRSRYFFFQVAPELYSWGWVDPVPDPLLLRKYGSAGNRTHSGSVARNSDLDHRGSQHTHTKFRWNSKPSIKLGEICCKRCIRNL